MKIVENEISKKELLEMSEKTFGNFVKAVVDIEKKIMAIDADLHSDEEALLLEKGSKQQNLWGINLYPEHEDKNWVEFDSMINLRPTQGNRGRGIDDIEIQKKIVEVVNKLIKK